MKCPRCQGIFQQYYAFDPVGSCEMNWVVLYQCLSCGNVTDSIIMENKSNAEAVRIRVETASLIYHTRKRVSHV